MHEGIKPSYRRIESNYQNILFFHGVIQMYQLPGDFTIHLLRHCGGAEIRTPVLQTVNTRYYLHV